MFSTTTKAIVHGYNKGLTDEFIEPSVIGKNKAETQESRISDNDSVIFFNLRSDRARQLTKPFVQTFQQDFTKTNPGAFIRKKVLNGLRFVAMTDFGPDLPGVLTAYPSVDIEMTLPMALSNLKQLYIAETEKYAHVTYFINGGYDQPVAGENRVMIESPNVNSYAETPEMSSPLILKTIINSLEKNTYDFICVNFCNPDMIGHTGNLEAAIAAIKYLDGCIRELVGKVLEKNGVLFITADHGNIEEMIDPKTGEVYTEHTSNPVPFIFISKDKSKIKFKSNGVLGSIAPTILEYLKIKKPKQMNREALCRF
jgi:2,3-bisphosphoglycerate-independent phosphoglycerate mutase